MKREKSEFRLPDEYIEWLKKRLSSLGTSYLFGSRTDMSARGGDIDVLLLSDKKLSFLELANIRKDFIMQFGEQKIDLVNYTYYDNNPFKELIMMDAKAL